MADLPDTDDPHELLGVPREATADETRRAYLRRIKVFKPDRDPEAFRRLRAAYEVLQSRFELAGRLRDVSAAAPGWDLDAEEPPPAPKPPTQTRGQRMAELSAGVHAALVEHRHDEAARLLLTDEAELLAVEPDFTPPLLDVCSATVWSARPLYEALLARYPDVIAAADSSTSPHWRHPLWDLRSLDDERSGWLHQSASVAELTHFLEVGALGRGEAARVCGESIAARVRADPMKVLGVLDRALVSAPGVIELLTERAETWADDHGAEAPPKSGDNSPTAVALVRQVEAGLGETRRVAGEWFKRATVTLSGPAVVIAVGGSLTPLLFALLVGSLTYHIVFDANRSLYAKVVRPTVVPWLIATGQPLAIVAEQLRSQLQARSAAFRLLRPDAPLRYPQMLDKDRALQAFAALARVAKVG